MTLLCFAKMVKMFRVITLAHGAPPQQAALRKRSVFQPTPAIGQQWKEMKQFSAFSEIMHKLILLRQKSVSHFQETQLLIGGLRRVAAFPPMSAQLLTP